MGQNGTDMNKLSVYAKKILLTSTRKGTEFLVVSIQNLTLRYNPIGNSPWCHWKILVFFQSMIT